MQPNLMDLPFETLLAIAKHLNPTDYLALHLCCKALPMDDNQKRKLFQNAINHGQVHIIEMLHSDRSFDPSYNNNFAIRHAIGNGFTEIVRLLFGDQRVDPSSHNYEPLVEASKKGYSEIVELLLTDARVNLSSFAISKACEQGHIQVIKVLLADERIDPTDFGLGALSRNTPNYFEVMKLLSQDARVPMDKCRHYCYEEIRQNRNSKLIQSLLQDPYVDESGGGNFALQQASERGMVEVVQSLLNDNSVDPSDNDNYALKQASANGHVQIVRLLLNNTRVINNSYFIAEKLASDNCHSEVMQCFVESRKTQLKPNQVEKDLVEAVSNRNVALARKILIDNCTNQEISNAALHVALDVTVEEYHCELAKMLFFCPFHTSYNEGFNSFFYIILNRGYVEMVHELRGHIRLRLEEQDTYRKYLEEGINRPNYCNMATYLLNSTPRLRFSAKKAAEKASIPMANIEAVRFFLDAGADPSESGDHYLIRLAIDHEQREILEFLVKDPRLKEYQNVIALYMASANGDLENVRLIKDKVPFSCLRWCVYIACSKGHIEIARYLIPLSGGNRFDESYNLAIQDASKKGYAEIVRLLLKNSYIDPANHQNMPIRLACANGQSEIVKILLAVPAVNPSDYDNYAILKTCRNGHTEVVELLLQDARVDPSADYNGALRRACENGHVEIVRLLLADSRVES